MIKGNAFPSVNLVGKIRSEGTIVGSLSKPVGYDTYEGSYEVTPQCESQTMNTNNKLMKKDFVVQAVPYYEVGNTQGGTVIIIGG